MSTFTLTIGLVIREGQRTWRLDRTLDDTRLVFFDLENGAPKTLSVAQLQNDLLAGRLQVVQEYPVALSSDTSAPTRLVTTIQDLPEREQLRLKVRLAYVKHMLRLGLKRGMRPQISAALARLKGQLPAGIAATDISQDVRSPSASTVMEWMRKFEISGGNPMALLSGNCFRTCSRRLNAVVQEVARRKIRTFYCTRNRPSMRETKLLIDKELKQHVDRQQIDASEAKISISTLRRLILDVSPYDRCVARYGQAYATNLWRYSLGGVDVSRILQRYEIDHTILDLVVIDDVTGMPMGRPTITVVVDSFSGYIAGLHISFWSPGLANALAAFKVAIRPKDFLTEHAGLRNKWLAYGIPDLMVVDNGLEFHSKHFHAAAMHLATDVLHCAVRQPWLKPMVERAIGTINGYLPAPGRVEKRLTNYIPLSPEKTACITFGSLCMALLKAVVDVHPFEENDFRLERPYDLYSDGLSQQLAPRLASSLDELDIIMARSKIMKIGNEGFVTDYIRYNSPEFQDIIRRRTDLSFLSEVRLNPEDIDYAWVQDPRTKGWLRVPSCYPKYTRGLSRVQHKAIRAQAKIALKLKDAEEALTRAKLELLEMWGSAIWMGKRIKGALLRSMVGMTSNTVLSQENKSTAPTPTQQKVPVAKYELLAAPQEYETYEFN